MSVLLVGIGGFIGSITRFYMSRQINHKFIATWLTNITGSILLAFLLHLYLTSVISVHLWLLLGVGFCGAYTTFSTFGNETLQFILDKRYGMAICYMLSSVGISLLSVALILHVH